LPVIWLKPLFACGVISHFASLSFAYGVIMAEAVISHSLLAACPGCLPVPKLFALPLRKQAGGRQEDEGLASFIRYPVSGIRHLPSHPIHRAVSSAPGYKPLD